MRAVRRRMSCLFEAGLVERFRPQTQRGAYQWVYCLARDGFRAAEQAGDLPEGLKFTPRRERIFDYRYVIHDLLVNEWALRYRELIGGALMDWEGPDESRLEPPRRSELGNLVGEGGRVSRWGIDIDALGPVHPDARMDVDDGERGHTAVFVEYDRTRRVDKNYDKFRRYEALLAGWWRRSELAHWAPPVIVFVCQDQEHAHRFLNAADAYVTAGRERHTADGFVTEYPARDRFLFVLDEHVRTRGGLAFQIPYAPHGRPGRVDETAADAAARNGGG